MAVTKSTVGSTNIVVNVGIVNGCNVVRMTRALSTTRLAGCWRRVNLVNSTHMFNLKAANVRSTVRPRALNHICLGTILAVVLANTEAPAPCC